MADVDASYSVCVMRSGKLSSVRIEMAIWELQVVAIRIRPLTAGAPTPLEDLATGWVRQRCSICR